MKYLISSSILEGHQAFEMAHSCDLQKENKAAAEWFLKCQAAKAERNNVTEAGDFEPADELPKYHWFICHLPYVQADLHYDYGADYYFLVKEVGTEGK